MRVAREVGGSDLGTVLRTLSELLRADARTRAELETRQGWVVNAARLAVAAPWLVLLLLGTQSATLRAYDTAGGDAAAGDRRGGLRAGVPDHAAHRPAARGAAGAAVSAWLLGGGARAAGRVGVVVAVRATPPMRPVRLADRIAPYLGDTPAPSRLLARPAATSAPFTVMRRLFGPVLGEAVGARRPGRRRRGLGPAPAQRPRQSR